MVEKKQDNPIGYRPSDDMKKIFEKYCSEKSKISKSELIEIAMRSFTSQDEDAIKKQIMGFLFGEPDFKNFYRGSEVAPNQKIQAWFAEKNYSPNTIRLYVCAFNAVYKFAIARNYLKLSPVKLIKPKILRGPPKWVDPKIIDKVLKLMDEDTRAPFEIMKYSGLRPSECLRLKVKNVTNNLRILDLYPEQTKTAERGLIPIHPKLKPLFKKLIKGKEAEDYLFPSRAGGHKRWLRATLKRKCVEANVSRFTPYQLRHTFATLILYHRGDAREVQQLLRHSNITMTQRYATTVDKRLEEAVKSLK